MRRFVAPADMRSLSTGSGVAGPTVMYIFVSISEESWNAIYYIIMHCADIARNHKFILTIIISYSIVWDLKLIMFLIIFD